MDLGETLRKEKLKDEKRIPKNGKLIHKGFEYCNSSFIRMIFRYSMAKYHLITIQFIFSWLWNSITVQINSLKYLYISKLSDTLK